MAAHDYTGASLKKAAKQPPALTQAEIAEIIQDAKAFRTDNRRLRKQLRESKHRLDKAMAEIMATAEFLNKSAFRGPRLGGKP